MKRIVSLALSLLMIFSALSMFSVISFAEGQTMLIKPSRYGAWENWVNSPNLVGDYDSTTQLLIEATDAEGNALVLPADAQWELTISSGSSSKTIKMNPATTLPGDNLYRFETCNGVGENKFVPVKGTNYTVSAKIYSGGEVIYQSSAVSGFTCGMDPVDPAVEMAEPEDTATLTLGAWYGKIENWGTPTRTYFIVGMSASECNDTLYTRLKNGKYKMHVTVTDETADTTKTVYYPINLPATELYSTSFIRLALAEKGVEVVKDHAYTLEIKVYNTAGELKYSGKSAEGAFKSTQEAFLQDGPINTAHYPVGDPESPLAEKSVLFVGDSITEAICEVNIAETRMIAGWPGRIGVANNMYFVNKGLSGASISTCRGSNTVLNQLKAMKNRTFDLVIMHGGANDAWDSTAVGKMTAIDNFDETTFDQATFAGGLEYLFWYAKTYYPDAAKGYLISFQLPGATIGRLSDMSEYFNEAKKICDKWGIPYLDMYNNEELNARMKGTTRYAMGDYIHPNDRGYDILYPFVEQFCECVLEGGDPATLPTPAPLPTEGNGITSADINVSIGKPAKNGAGTSIPGATDGKTAAYVSLGNWDGANCYVEIDLNTYYKVNKINVVNYIGNLLYNWEAYVTEDNTLPIDQWTMVGEKNNYKQSYEDGNTISFEPITAKYVRIYGTYHNGSSAYVVNEVSVYGTPDEEAILGGATVENIVTPDMSATLTDSSTTDKLTDGNKVSDPMTMTQSSGGWCQADLGSAKTISKIIVNLAEVNSAFKLIASTDGITWTTIATKAVNEITTTTPRNQFIVTGINASYRYVRVQWLASERGDGYVSVSELEIFGEDGETRLTATASVSNAVYNGTQDGSYTSYSFIKGSTDTITVDLGASHDIRKIVLYTTDYRHGFRIEVSENGSTYTSFGANTVTNLYDSEVGYVLYGDATFRYIRIIPTAFVDDTFSAYELEVFAVTETTDPEPDPKPDTPTEEELTDKEEVTITLGNGSAANGLKDDATSGNYTLIAEGDKCYALIDLQKAYTVTKAVIYALNGNYLFEIYGSTDGETWTKLAANEKSASYNAADGFVMTISGNYRYIKVVGTECQHGYFTTYEMDVFGYEATVTPDPEPDPEPDPDTPAEEELTDKEEVTITLGNGSAANGLKDDATSGNYTLIAEGDKCYALIDLQKTYTVTKAVIYALNGNYLFEIYGSTDGETWTKLAANEKSTSYVAAEGFTLTLSGNYRYIKVVGTECQYGYFTTYEMDVFGYEATVTPEPEPKPETPAEEELTAKAETTITLGNGSAANGLKDNNTSSNYTLIAEGDKCYALIDLQKSYTVTKAVIYALNGNYLFEIYGSTDGETWTKLAANEKSTSYVAAEGFTLTLSGNYRYIKVVGTECQFGYFTTYEMDVFGHEIVYAPDTPMDSVVDENTTVTAGGVATDKLTDGNKVSDPLTFNAANGWCQADLGSAQKISKIIVALAEKNSAFKLIASVDGQTWTTIATKEINEITTTSPRNQFIVTDINASYRYVRVVWMDSQRPDGYVSVSELEIYGEDGTTRLTATASISDAVYNSTQDGSYTSYSFIRGNKNDVIIDLGEEKAVNKIVLYPVSDAYGAKIFVSTDGTTYSAFGEMKVGGSYTLFGEGTCRYIKIVPTDTVDGNFSAYEIEILAKAESTEPPAEEDAVVKFEGHQMGTDGDSIRFIGSISGLDYETVDLQITVTGDAERTFSNPTTKVFQVLKGSIAGINQAIAATANSGVTGENVTVIDAPYLFGYAITGIDAGTYTFEIVPVATTYDGQTVKGETATITVTID